MKNNDIIEYYDYLMQLAILKCGSQADAEDLVGDTMLAAYTYIRGGKTIEHPKTWLANTLLHKHNDRLRKKYRSPVTVCLDEGLDIFDEEEDSGGLTSEEAAKVRKELNYLAYITREVLIRFYYGNQSIATIAKGLGVPEGTVKSRLHTGRSQVKKGIETMEELISAVGEDWAAFAASKRTPLPKHLTSVPELYRYTAASQYFVMAIVREAYEKGLHMKGVDYCCPPVVLVYEE